MPEKSVDIIEVFVDEFIGATNNSDLTHLLHLSCWMLHVIRAISLSSEVIQHGGGDSVYEKKLNKGGVTWAHKKEILGWIFNDQTTHYSYQQKKSKNPRPASEHQ